MAAGRMRGREIETGKKERRERADIGKEEGSKMRSGYEERKRVAECEVDRRKERGQQNEKRIGGKEESIGT